MNIHQSKLAHLRPAWQKRYSESKYYTHTGVHTYQTDNSDSNNVLSDMTQARALHAQYRVHAPLKDLSQFVSLIQIECGPYTVPTWKWKDLEITPSKM